jgi:hypothetical protein
MRTTAMRVALTTLALALLAAPGMAAVTWNYAGTASATTTPGWLQDYKRVRYYSAVVDPAGRVYVTAGTNGREQEGSISIFTPNDASNPTSWTQIDVDMTAAGAPRGVTKLVVAGDGRVYGLQNWLEVAWGYSGTLNPGRIVRINPTTVVADQVDIIKEYPLKSDSSTDPAWGVWLNRPMGLTVGGDGNVYWTVGGNDSVDCPANCYKYHYFWRYDIVSDTVEEGPINTINNGWSENHKIFDLEYVEDSWFAVVSAGGGIASAGAMGWTHNRNQAANGDINPQWGVGSIINKLAYDRTWNKLWYGPFGSDPGTSTKHTVIMGRWNGALNVDDPENPMLANTGLFEAAPSSGQQPGIGLGVGGCYSPNWDGWHANGNDPNGTTGGVANPVNGGRYWVNALAVNPGSSAAWMSWGSDANYNNTTVNPDVFNGPFAPVGKVYVVQKDACGPSSSDPDADQGTPQAGLNSNPSQVVALAFWSDKILAVTCDMSTGQTTSGQFNLFWATNPTPPVAGACCTADGCIDGITSSECPTAEEFYANTTCDGRDDTTRIPVDCRFRICHDPVFDADNDGDVDQEDFAVLQACITGTGISDFPIKCSCFNEATGDTPEVVNGADLYLFEQCASGPGIPVDPACDNPAP